MLYESDHLRLAAENGVATLTITGAGRNGDRLTGAVLGQFDRALRAVRRAPGLDLLVLRGDLAGLDPEELAGFRAESDWLGLARLGQAVCRRLALLSPRTRTVAVIDGPCVGAGLELALACDCRIAVARPDTLLGLDQVALGLTPCWGGTWRLPRLIGLRVALPLLLGGPMLSGREALAVGLVDHAFCERVASAEVWGFCNRVQRGWRPYRRPGWFRFGERRLLRDARTRPVEQAALRAVAAGWLGTPAEAEAEERRSVARLGMTPECHNLLHRAAEAIPAGRPARGEGVIEVIGSDEAAAVLAARAVLRGSGVVLHEPDAAARAEVLRRVEQLLDEARRRGLQTPLEAANRLKAVQVTTGPDSQRASA
jgi:enoyl-CoA hydratase/carnithine racemase